MVKGFERSERFGKSERFECRFDPRLVQIEYRVDSRMRLRMTWRAEDV